MSATVSRKWLRLMPSEDQAEYMRLHRAHHTARAELERLEAVLRRYGTHQGLEGILEKAVREERAAPGTAAPTACGGSMTASYTITLPGLPDLQQARSRWHWAQRARHDKQWREAIAWSVKSWRLKAPFEHALVECVRFSAVEPDRDNLTISFKPCIDGLVEGGAIVDDGPANVRCTYRWEPAKRHEGYVRIVLTPVEITEISRNEVARLCAELKPEDICATLGGMVGQSVLKIGGTT